VWRGWPLQRLLALALGLALRTRPGAAYSWGVQPFGSAPFAGLARGRGWGSTAAAPREPARRDAARGQSGDWACVSMSAARNVKVRSVTAFVTIPAGACEHAGSLREALEPACALNARMQKELEAAGFEVQTTRIASNSFEDYLPLAEDAALASQLDTLKTVLEELNINFFNLGQVFYRRCHPSAPSLLAPSDDVSHVLRHTRTLTHIHTHLRAFRRQAHSDGGIDKIPKLLLAVPSASASCDLQCIYIRTYMHAYTHTHTHTHSHTHTHTHKGGGGGDGGDAGSRTPRQLELRPFPLPTTCRSRVQNKK